MSDVVRRRSRGAPVDVFVRHRTDLYFHFNLLSQSAHEIEELSDSVNRATNVAELDDFVEIAPDPEVRRVGALRRGRLIAWMPDDVVADYYDPLLQAVSDGKRVHARIVGQWDLPTEWDPNPAGEFRNMATVHLPLASELIPLNSQPRGSAITLPLGGTVNVTGEDAYMDNIRPWVHPDGTSAVVCTLHAVTVHRPRSTRRVVEVRIEGQPVGTLSDKLSDQRIALVDELERHGLTVACYGRVAGNAISAEVTVFPAPPQKISNAWILEELGRLGI